MSGKAKSFNSPNNRSGKRMPFWVWILIALAIAAIIAVIICIIYKWKSRIRKEGFEQIKSNDVMDIAPETSYLESYIKTALCYNGGDSLVQVDSNNYASE